MSIDFEAAKRRAAFVEQEEIKRREALRLAMEKKQSTFGIQEAMRLDTERKQAFAKAPAPIQSRIRSGNTIMAPEWLKQAPGKQMKPIPNLTRLEQLAQQQAPTYLSSFQQKKQASQDIPAKNQDAFLSLQHRGTLNLPMQRKIETGKTIAQRVMQTKREYEADMQMLEGFRKSFQGLREQQLVQKADEFLALGRPLTKQEALEERALIEAFEPHRLKYGKQLGGVWGYSTDRKIEDLLEKLRAQSDALNAAYLGAVDSFTFGMMKEHYEPMKIAKTAHPISYGTGELAVEAAKYYVAGKAVKSIPRVTKAISKAGSGISRILGGKVSQQTASRLLTGRAVDLVPDVAQSAANSNNFEEFLKDLVMRTEIGIGTDLTLESLFHLYQVVKTGQLANPSLEMPTGGTAVKEAERAAGQAVPNQVEIPTDAKLQAVSQQNDIAKQIASQAAAFQTPAPDVTGMPILPPASSLVRTGTGTARPAPAVPSRNVSRVFSHTYTNSSMFEQAEKQALLQGTDTSYNAVSELQSLTAAKRRLAANYSGELASLPQKLDFNGEDIDTAMGVLERLLKEARQTNDYTAAFEWAKMIQERGTQAGQLVQSFAKYSRTPEGALLAAERIADQGEKQIKAGNKKLWGKVAKEIEELKQAVKQGDVKKLEGKLSGVVKRETGQQATFEAIVTEIKNGQRSFDEIEVLVKKKYGIPAFSQEDAQNILEFMERAKSFPEGSYLSKMWEARAKAVIQRQVPKSFGDKLATVLMDNMLGNFRTLIARNASGNLIFAAPEGFRSQFIAAPLDKLLSLRTNQRTTLFSPLSQTKKWAQGFGHGLADWGRDVRFGVHTPRTAEEVSMLAQSRTFRGNHIGGKIGNLVNDIVGRGLELGDRPFYEAAYAARMAELERIRDMGKLGPEFAGKAFEDVAPVVAARDALEAVFQNPGHISKALGKMKQALNSLSEGLTGLKFAGQTNLPFTQTPGNMVERSVEYSPVGVLKNAMQTGQELRKGMFDQRRFVTEASRNILGTGLFTAGAASAANGLLTGPLSSGKDQRAAQQAVGQQPYAIKIGDNYFSYEWVPVMGPALASGASFQQAWQNAKKPGKALLSGVTAAAGTAVEQSALQGLTRMFGGNDAVSGFGDAVSSGLGQFVPSIVRQGAAISDPYMRETYHPNPMVQQANRIATSIPVLRQTLPEKIDAQGNPVLQNQGRGLFSKMVENAILPGKLTRTKKDEVTLELMRLYREGGYTKQFQQLADKVIRYDGGKEIALNPLEYQQGQKQLGKRSTEILQTVLQSPIYSTLNDAEKVELISNALDASREEWKTSVLKQRGIPVKESAKAERMRLAEKKGVSAGQYLAYKALQSKADSGGSLSGREAILTSLEQDKSLSEEKRNVIAEVLIIEEMGENRKKSWETFYKNKLSAVDYIRIVNTYSRINASTYPKTKGGKSAASLKATDFAHFLDTLALSAFVKESLAHDFTYFHMTPANPVPYRLSQMPKSAQKKYLRVKSLGMSEKDFLKFYPVIMQQKKKAQILAELIKAGMDYEHANTFWNLMKKK